MFSGLHSIGFKGFRLQDLMFQGSGREVLRVQEFNLLGCCV